MALAAILLAGVPPAVAAGVAVEEIVTRSGDSGKRIVVEVVPGPVGIGKSGLGNGRYGIPPQVAVWTEDASGRLLETLFVTRNFAQQQRFGVRPDFKEDETFRTGVLNTARPSRSTSRRSDPAETSANALALSAPDHLTDRRPARRIPTVATIPGAAAAVT